jgi:hypothetical protein
MVCAFSILGQRAVAKPPAYFRFVSIYLGIIKVDSLDLQAFVDPNNNVANCSFPRHPNNTVSYK